MTDDIFIFVAALFMVIKGATMSTKYASRLAGSTRLSKYAVAFLVIAVIGILPEAFIAVSSAMKGIPSFGLSVLFGSNIADLTLVFALIVFLTGRDLKIESKIVKHETLPFLLLLPVVLGLDGHFSRLEGIALMIAGAIFYYISFKNGLDGSAPTENGKEKYKNLFFLLLGMAVLLAGSHFTVASAASLAGYLKISPILIGMLIVGLGTTMPELFFSVKSAKNHDDSLAVGDILGTVLADATVVVGVLAVVSPFSFPQRIIYVTGLFMVLASFVLFHCMRTGRTLSKKEACALFGFWLFFVLVEFIANK